MNGCTDDCIEGREDIYQEEAWRRHDIIVGAKGLYYFFRSVQTQGKAQKTKKVTIAVSKQASKQSIHALTRTLKKVFFWRVDASRRPRCTRAFHSSP